jgi:hypothetical protein
MPASPQDQGGLKTFESEQFRYSVRYPANWRLADPKTLLLFDFPQSRAVRGAVIPDGGASIYVTVPSELTHGREAPANLDDWVALGSEHKKITERQTLRLDRGGRTLSVVEVGAWCCGTLPPDNETIEWFFEVDGHMFLAGLEYSGNVDMTKLRGTLEQIALSLKVT